MWVQDLIRYHALHYTAVCSHAEMCEKFTDVFPASVETEHCELDTVRVD